MKDRMVLVLSLKGDVERRSCLKRRFKKGYNDFHILDAVDYRDAKTPEGLSGLFGFEGITKSEAGCTSSHIEALAHFLSTDNKHCLIFEDDIIGNDLQVSFVFDLAQRLPEDLFMICGGMQGLNRCRFVLGTESGVDGVLRVCRFTYTFMLRTCCYMVSRSAAHHLLERHRARFGRADDWSYLLKGYDGVFYSDVFCHPEDLSQSRIESSRAASKGGLWDRLRDDGFITTIGVNLRKVLSLSLSFLPWFSLINIKKAPNE